MKTKHISLLVCALALISTNGFSQKITIDNVPPPKQFEKFDSESGQEKKITGKFLKENDLVIAVANSIKLKSLSVRKGENIEALKVDNNNPLDGLVKYRLPKGEYTETIDLELLTTGNKKYSTSIQIVPDDQPGIKEDQKEIICKNKLKNKLNYKFIDPDIFQTDICKSKDCYTCSNKNEIVYDFSTNTIDNKLVLKVGEPASFRIKNLNPLLYDVTITDNPINNNQDLTDILKLLNGADFLKNVTLPTAVKADAFDGSDCELTLEDKISVAVIKLATEISNLNGQLQTLSPYYDAFCYRDLLQSIKKQINSALSLYFHDDNINSFNDLISFLEIRKDTSKPDVVAALNTSYQKLFSPHVAYLYKIPEVQNVDEIDFLFNILPKNKDAALPVVKNGIIKVYTKGGFKIDVSSGLYYGFMNNLQYSIRGDSNVVKGSTGADSTTKVFSRLYQEDAGKGEFGFSSLLHFYRRSGTGINFSPIIGAGVSFQDIPQIRYFAGAGLLLGRDDRIAINAGAVFGNVSQLSSQYSKDNNGSYNILSASEAGKDPLLIKRFQIKSFISITYNLSFIKKKTETQTITAPETTQPVNNSAAANDEGAEGKGDGSQKTGGSNDTTTVIPQSTGDSSNAGNYLLKNATKIKIKK